MDQELEDMRGDSSGMDRPSYFKISCLADFDFFLAADEDDDAAEGAVEMDSGESEVEGDDGDGGGGEEGQPSGSAAVEDKVYVPGQPLEDGEELVHDSSAYHMYHAERLLSMALART